MRALGSLMLLSALAWSAPATAQSPREQVRRLAPGQASPAATLADAQWLVGHWIGDMPEGPVEQVFLAPVARQMPSFVRAIGREGILFYEISNLVESEGSLRFRLRHFTPELVGWEDAGGAIERRLIAIENGNLYFDRISLIRSGPDSYIVYFLNMAGDEERETITVPFRRVRKGEAR
jgi:hypothetical protein